MHLLTLDWFLILEKFILIVVIIFASLGIALYTTFAERKVAAVLQDRRAHVRVVWRFPDHHRAGAQLRFCRQRHGQPVQGRHRADADRRQRVMVRVPQL